MSDSININIEQNKIINAPEVMKQSSFAGDFIELNRNDFMSLDKMAPIDAKATGKKTMRPNPASEEKQRKLEEIRNKVRLNMPVSKQEQKEIDNAERENLRRAYNNMKEEDRQALRDKKTYRIKKLDTMQLMENRKKSAKLKIGNVSDAIMEVCPESYRKMHARLTDDNIPEEDVELVHSMGDLLLKQGHDVLEIDVAGSSFHQWRREYNGYHGKTDGLEGKKEDSQYGKQIHEGNNYEWVKERNYKGRNKKRYTFAGPLKFDGLINGGDYSIEKDRARILEYGKSYVVPIFNEWIDKIKNNENPDYHQIDIMLRGHSRGAVACSHGAMMLKAWLYENYPQFENYVKFHITQYDPVPGGDVELKNSIAGNLFERFDIGEYDGVHDGVFEIDGQKMKALSDSSNSTVLYSITNQDDFSHNNLFKPQEVLHAKRVILIPTTHDMGLDLANIDTTQMAEGTKEKAHGMAYYDAASDKVYRNSGLGMMDEGVYVMDENQILIKVENEVQLNALLDKIMKKGHQEARQERLKSACRSVLSDKVDTDDYAALDHIRTNSLMDTIVTESKSIFASGFRHQIGEAITGLKLALSTDIAKENCLKYTIDAFDEVLSKCNAYIRKRDKTMWTARGMRRLRQIKSLSRALTREKNHLLSLNTQANGDLFEVLGTYGPIGDLLSKPARIDYKDVSNEDNGKYRLQKGEYVTVFEQKDIQTAKSMAFCSLATESLGVRSLYQGVMTAEMDKGIEVVSGIVKENLTGIRLDDVSFRDRVNIEFSKTAKNQLEQLKVLDILYGIKDRKDDPLSGLRGDVDHFKNDRHVVIKNIYAEGSAAPVFGGKVSALLTDEEKETIRNMGKAGQNLIKSMDHMEMLKAVSILMPTDFAAEVFESRILEMKRIIE